MASKSSNISSVSGGAGSSSPSVGADGLSVQDVTVDAATLTPLTRQVISRQATINIGTIGHVAHGKSTTVKAVSGVYTIKYKAEKVRNITIKLGYANAKIYKSSAAPWVYTSRGSETPDEWPMPRDPAGRTWQLVRHVSFVDCPGHDILMATMLNGAAVMDAALLLIAASEPCPQPQTSEHLAAVDIMQLKNIIILQNKVDLVKEEQARDQYEKIKSFVTGTVAEGAPIIPISAQLQYNIDVLAQYLACAIPVPTRNFTAPPRLLVIRSFDVNKPGEEIERLKGGVAGGSITQGVLRLGDEIELRPGIITKSADGAVTCTPMYSKILSLYAEKNPLQFAVPGGLIGVGTQIDPTLTRTDRLVGQVLGHKGSLPDVFIRIRVQYHLLRRLLGVKGGGAASSGGASSVTAGSAASVAGASVAADSIATASSDKASRVSKLKTGEILMANIGSTSTSATVIAVTSTEAELSLAQPVCTELSGTGASAAKIALSRRIENHWRLIGWGNILSGEKARGPKKSKSAATATA